MRRGEIWWADLPEPTASEPGHRRPLLIIQADSFNRSRIQTVVCAVITSNMRLADMPGNCGIRAEASGLTRDSVVNVSQVVTIDKRFLVERVGVVDDRFMSCVDDGLRLVLNLG